MDPIREEDTNKTDVFDLGWINIAVAENLEIKRRNDEIKHQKEQEEKQRMLSEKIRNYHKEKEEAIATFTKTFDALDDKGKQNFIEMRKKTETEIIANLDNIKQYGHGFGSVSVDLDRGQRASLLICYLKSKGFIVSDGWHGGYIVQYSVHISLPPQIYFRGE
jgi:hypothetical protein